jgi:hypothetical protein
MEKDHLLQRQLCSRRMLKGVQSLAKVLWFILQAKVWDPAEESLKR